mmetsp:Transcript_91286/g.263420  ORF Transcript_91286/g.263420 Transcript_91286/m.263420 type:complete len:248 (+) Transcript_91286:1825-2568(+)
MDFSTALSIGSSLFAGLEATAAQTRASSCEKSFLVQASWGRTLMSAVVRVPVLSEHRIDIEATSCKAVRCVIIAFFLAILAAPMAIVTCMTSGNAMGTAPITNAKTFSKAVVNFSSRPWTLTQSTTPASSKASSITTRTTCMIFVSNMPTVCPEASCTKPAAWPISVRRPVSLTMQCPSPCLTIQPESNSRPAPSGSPSRSGRGTFLGTGSPVRAAVSTSIWSPSSHSQSAGTTFPPRRNTTSPGTN